MTSPRPEIKQEDPPKGLTRVKTRRGRVRGGPFHTSYLPVKWLGLLLVLLTGCNRGPEGAFRDQLLFLADDGAVLALVLVRGTDGAGEAKGWLGLDGRWGVPVYDHFPLAPRRAADLPASVRAWASAGHASARASLRQTDAGLHLALRSPSARLSLDAEAPVALGTARDPEGTSRYAAARASLRAAGLDRGGWLITEDTPADTPRRPLVEYGDFVFVALATRGGDLLVAKRSHGRRGFDLLVGRRSGQSFRDRRVDVELEGEQLVVTAPRLPVPVPVTIRDRVPSTGTAPDGKKVGYDVLLLGGAPASSWTGVAFTIRPGR